MSEEREYYGDNLTPEQRSRAMSAIKSRDTAPELALRRALRRKGVSGYRTDSKELPGRPDISFGRKRLAVFVDGGFWHGRADRVRPGRSTYWDSKIKKNAERDVRYTQMLRERGWQVLRLWDDDVLRDPEGAALRVIRRLTAIPVAEFFAGIGLVRLALEDAGFEVAFANDIDATKQTLYSANFDASHFWMGDIRYVTGAQIPNVMLATASFPCTDISLAGTRAGLDGKQSGVFWEFVRVIREMEDRRPQVVMLENVAGLGSSKGGADLALAIKALNDLGYCCDVVQLDARRWVPQSRQRVFVIGSRLRLQRVVGWEASELRPAWIGAFVEAHPELGLQAADLALPPPLDTALSGLIERLPPEHDRWWDERRLRMFVSSLSALNSGRLQALVSSEDIEWRTAYRRTRGGQATWEIRADRLSGCLRTARGGSSKQALVEVGQGQMRIRWMTPREYARLMGASEFQLDSVSENKALFGLGDAVCVPAVAWLAREYLRPLLDGQITQELPERVAS